MLTISVSDPLDVPQILEKWREWGPTLSQNGSRLNAYPRGEWSSIPFFDFARSRIFPKDIPSSIIMSSADEALMFTPLATQISSYARETMRPIRFFFRTGDQTFSMVEVNVDREPMDIGNASGPVNWFAREFGGYELMFRGQLEVIPDTDTFFKWIKWIDPFERFENGVIPDSNPGIRELLQVTSDCIVWSRSML